MLMKDILAAAEESRFLAAGPGSAAELETMASSESSVAEAIAKALRQDLDVLASFCIIWPSEFVFSAECGPGLHIQKDDLFAVPRSTLLSALGVGTLGERPFSTSWQLDHLPVALRRIPFAVPGTTKLALPISLGGHIVGIVGMCSADGREQEALRREDVWAKLPGRELPLALDRTLDDDPARRGAELPAASGGNEKPLSPREAEIARYLGDGYSIINIGAILGVSPNTVRTYVRRIYAKLNVCSRVELVRRIC